MGEWLDVGNTKIVYNDFGEWCQAACSVFRKAKGGYCGFIGFTLLSRYVLLTNSDSFIR